MSGKAQAHLRGTYTQMAGQVPSVLEPGAQTPPRQAAGGRQVPSVRELCYPDTQCGGVSRANGLHSLSTAFPGPGCSINTSTSLLSPLQRALVPPDGKIHTHTWWGQAPRGCPPLFNPFGCLRHKQFLKVAEGTAASPTKLATASVLVNILGVSSTVLRGWKGLGTLKP